MVMWNEECVWIWVWMRVMREGNEETVDRTIWVCEDLSKEAMIAERGDCEVYGRKE